MYVCVVCACVHIYIYIYINIYINIYWYKAYSLRGTSLAHVAREGPHAAVTFSCQGMRRESGHWVGGGYVRERRAVEREPPGNGVSRVCADLQGP